MSKWISKYAHYDKVEQLLGEYEFDANTLQITHLSDWNLQVTFLATKKINKEL